MNVFAKSLSVEREGMNLLIPALEAMWQGMYVVPLQGQSAPIVKLQQEFGDLLIFSKDPLKRHPQAAEVKVERRTPSGSFYAETWSNNLRNPGWVVNSHATYLIYVFLEPSPIAYVMDMPSFKGWVRDNERRLKVRRPDANREQLNETVGVLAPIDEVLADFKRTGARFRVLDLVQYADISPSKTPQSQEALRQ